MSYRYVTDLLTEYAGKTSRRLRSMLSLRWLSTIRADQTATATGRQAADGGYEEDEARIFQPVGFVSLPPSNATIEGIVGFVGAYGDHPVILAQYDPGAQTVIKAAGLTHDESITYTQLAMVKLTKNGEVLAGSHAGSHQTLGYHSDDVNLNNRITALELAVNALVTAFNAHVHTSATAGSPTSTPMTPPATPLTVPPAATSATVTGTSKLKAD